MKSLSDATNLEYQSVRREITMRARLLHQLLAMTSLIEFVAVIVGFRLSLISESLFWEFFLVLPVLTTTILFNYQANQMTLEALAAYSDRLHKNNTEGSWDDYYGTHKSGVRIVSFLKVTPFFLPFIFPIWQLTFPLSGQLSHLAWFDMVLLVIAIGNFSYKWRKPTPR